VLQAALPHFIAICKDAAKTADMSGVPICVVLDRYSTDDFAEHPFHYCPQNAVSMLHRHGTILETLQP
jgi:hypothetical protein